MSVAGQLGQWKVKTVLCRCDNAAVVAIINSGRSKNDLVMHLMRSLFFFTARYNVVLRAVHLTGRHNQAADTLSRDNVPLFLRQVPLAEKRPTPLPSDLLAIMLHRRLDWSSHTWRSRCATLHHRHIFHLQSGHESITLYSLVPSLRTRLVAVLCRLC